MSRFVLVIILVITSIKTYAGGGWTQGRGNGFFMLSQRYIGGSFYANNSSEIIQTPEDWFGVFTTHFYAEYGITNRLDIIGHSPFITGSVYYNYPSQDMPQNIDPNKQANWSFGDVDIAAKYKIYSKGVNVSATIQLGFATGKYKPGFYGNISPVTSDGDHNQMLKIDASGSIGKNLFYSLFAGFNNRTNGFSDELHFGGEIGRNGDKLVSILKIYSLNSFENGASAPAGLPGIYSNNLEYLAISPCFLYKLPMGWGVLAEFGFAPYLRNIIAAPSFSLGITKNVVRAHPAKN
ncbi:MAG: hypothetical protein ACPGLV_05510 [Bacteroidia bacterium]